MWKVNIALQQNLIPHSPNVFKLFSLLCGSGFPFFFINFVEATAKMSLENKNGVLF